MNETSGNFRNFSNAYDKIQSMMIILKRYAPAWVMMAIIFVLSSQPSSDLPKFDWADTLVKKSGHVIGYSLLALSYLRVFSEHKRRYWLAWSLAILYAITDEIHQSFVVTRHASIWDVILFDNFGAIAGLVLHSYRTKNH